jgi:hypothetical protein
MSQKPVGPREFNPVLGASVAGVAATAKAISGIADAIQDHHFVKHSLVPECQKVLRLSEQSRDRLIAMADSLRRSELQRARYSLIEIANEMHRKFVANFEPEIFSASVREARSLGERPGHLMWRWCRELVASPLWSMDKIQSVRMAGAEHRTEWVALERFKQEIVDLWGKAQIDVSRSEGREYNYVLRGALEGLLKFAGIFALALGTLVLLITMLQ